MVLYGYPSRVLHGDSLGGPSNKESFKGVLHGAPFGGVFGGVSGESFMVILTRI